MTKLINKSRFRVIRFICRNVQDKIMNEYKGIYTAKAMGLGQSEHRVLQAFNTES